MKKIMDKFFKTLKINKRIFIFLLVIIVLGIISGAIFSVIISNDDKAMVADYLNNFFNKLNSNTLNYKNSFLNCFVFTVIFDFIIWLLGISVIGFFVILMMVFLKSFVIGFSVSSLIINFKLKGILYSIIYIFPHQIINFLILILISSCALIISFKLISCINKKNTLSFKNIINKYILTLVFSIVVLIFTCLYETYMMPFIMKLVYVLLN